MNSCASNLVQENQCGFVCCSGMNCPISRRSAKREIRAVSPAEKARLYDQLQGIRLSTYQYRDQPASSSRRLGFIIDDTDAPAAIDPSGDRVDLYGYASMAVAAIQLQAREIELLKARLGALEASCAPPVVQRNAAQVPKLPSRR